MIMSSFCISFVFPLWIVLVRLKQSLYLSFISSWGRYFSLILSRWSPFLLPLTRFQFYFFTKSWVQPIDIFVSFHPWLWFSRPISFFRSSLSPHQFILVSINFPFSWLRRRSAPRTSGTQPFDLIFIHRFVCFPSSNWFDFSSQNIYAITF